MKSKVFIARLAAMAVLIGTLPTLVTCERENPRALFVYDVMAVSSRTDCVIQPGQRAQAVMSSGIMDVMLTNTYYMYPRFKNMLTNSLTLINEGPTSLQTEVNYLSIKGAVSWLDLGELNGDLDGAQQQSYLVDGIQHTVSAGLAPEEEGAVGIEVIKAEVGNMLGEQLRAKKGTQEALDINVYVMLQAENLAGEVIYSNEMGFPIKVCYGCLIAPSSSTQVSEMPCFPGQDYGVPWVMCRGLARYKDDCPTY